MHDRPDDGALGERQVLERFLYDLALLGDVFDDLRVDAGDRSQRRDVLTLNVVVDGVDGE